MKLTLAQISPKLKKISLDEFETYLENVDKESDLVFFPELALNGYMLKDAVFEDAYTLDEINKFAEFSKSYDLIFGAVLKEENKFFNSAFYCSDGQILKVHKKTALPNYGLFQEARFFFKGGEVKSFETKFGRAFVVICEELYNAHIIAKIADEKPDMVIVISNSPSRGFGDDGLLIQKQWESLLCSTALLSGANVVFVNRVGFEDGLGFWGGSCVVNAKAQIIKRAKLFEEENFTLSIDKKLSDTQKYLLREY